MDYVSCPFCNSVLLSDYINITTGLGGGPYKCFNHNICSNHNIRILLYKSQQLNKINEILIHNYKYYVYIYPLIDEMKIIGNNAYIELLLPLDKKLTPENFEERIKTYLLFS
jgi:hypothetical protein